MNHQIKTQGWLWVLIIILWLFSYSSCTTAPLEWKIKTDYQYSKSGIDYSLYTNLGILLFEDDELEDKILKKITFFAEEEFRKKKFNIVPSLEIDSFLSDSQISRQNLKAPEALERMRNALNISALVWGSVNQYVVRPEIYADPLTLPSPRSADYQVFNLCDISMTIEIIDTKNGDIIWSNEVYSIGGRIKGNPDWLIRRMVKECLKTVPKQ